MLTRRDFAKALAAAAVLPSPALAAPDTTMLTLQQRFLDLRFGMFIHLNMATFEQREWGDAKASPKLFNPARLDTDQWARAAVSANMRYGCLTTKHHDGFCLWPTATSSPSVKDATFTRDIVREYVDSFRKHNLHVFLYFSILDLRADIRPHTVTPEKITLIKAQLTELLTNYGEITALILDGWGASWSRIPYSELPYRTLYDHVKSLQPSCLVTDHNFGEYPGPALYYTDIKQYEQHAGQAIPTESNIPSQSGTTLQAEWFWKKSYPTDSLRSPKQIVNEWLIPFNERHCNLILNVSPNTDGRFDDNAVARLAEIGQLWQHPGAAPTVGASLLITTPDLARAQPAFASSIRDGSGPDLATDNDFSSYWRADDNQQSGWIELRPLQPLTFNTLSLIEPVSIDDYGPGRIVRYTVERWFNGAWVTVASGGKPSSFQLLRFPAVTSSRIRVTVDSATGSRPPGLTEFGLYNEP
jgi:alpha-L-fucosidase